MSCKSCNTPCYEQGTDHDICMAYTKKPFTNADRIRAMTDEELAEWFLTSGLPPGATKLVCHWDNRSQMKEEWLGWLKEERGG